MPETDHTSRPITSNECKLRHSGLEKDVTNNKILTAKLSKIIIGNGGVGLVEEVHNLNERNELINEVFGVIKSLLTTLVTLYLVGVLHL